MFHNSWRHPGAMVAYVEVSRVNKANWKDRQTGRQAGRQARRQTGRETGRQIGRQTHRQTGSARY